MWRRRYENGPLHELPGLRAGGRPMGTGRKLCMVLTERCVRGQPHRMVVRIRHAYPWRRPQTPTSIIATAPSDHRRRSIHRRYLRRKLEAPPRSIESVSLMGLRAVACGPAAHKPRAVRLVVEAVVGRGRRTRGQRSKREGGWG